MRYTKLRAGFEVSRVGMGCYALSGVYGPSDPDGFSSVLRKAYEMGVTFFDTADQYGDAEKVLGQAIRSVRDRVVISTKVGLTEGFGRDCSRRHVIAACERSLKNLGTDWIDIYQIHFDDPATPVEETVTALEELKTAGKIRAYGLGHLPRERVEEYIQCGRPATLMCELSAAVRRPYLQYRELAISCGIDLIGFSVTARGLLTGRIGPDHSFGGRDIRNIDALFYRERMTAALSVKDLLAHAGAQYGMTPAQVAVAWALRQPGVAAVLTGPRSPEHLMENLGGCDCKMPDAAWADVECTLAEIDCALERSLRQTIAALLAGELDPDPERAFRDLVYLIEGAVDFSIVSEKDVMPAFARLMAAKARREAERMQIMRDVHRMLSEAVENAGY
ncbi:MAG: aldo/keto reductase [Bacillota bacterium]